MTSKIYRKYSICFVILFIFPLILSFAETFRFKYKTGDKYRILSKVISKHYINGKYTQTYEGINKAVLTVDKKRGQSAFLSGTYYFFKDIIAGSVVPFEFEKQYYSAFWRDELGRFEIDDQYAMPVIRHIPTFPEQNIEPGYEWHAPAEDVQDFFYNSDFKEDLVRIPLEAHYRYLGKKTINKVELDMFSIHYAVNFYYSKWSKSNARVVRILGYSSIIYYFDNKKGIPHSQEETFDYIFVLRDGQTHEFKATSTGLIEEIIPLNKEKIKNEVQDEIIKQKIEDTSIKKDTRGIIISLENIHFAPNSAKLMPQEKDRLIKIAKILSQYKNSDLMVVGHTAYAPQYSEQAHNTLSLERAKTVSQFLLELNAVANNKLSFTGKGFHEPIADNDTEENRKKNRRVEIIILDN